MKKVTCNDGIGSRERRRRNLLLCPGMGIVEFTGKDIPPVLRVLRSDYEKNGKWSATTWTLEIHNDFHLVPHHQDWGTGKFFPVRTWDEAAKHLENSLKPKPSELGITPEMVERAIRAIFPRSAKEIDEAEEEFGQSGNVLAELLQAQTELACARKEETGVRARVRQMEEAEEMRRQALEIKERVNKAQEILKSGQKMSLADLKQLVGE